MTPPVATSPGLPPLLSGDALYDFLMSPIEPELTTAVLPTLAQKYEHETLEEKQLRAERYEYAFAEFDRKLHEYQKTCDRQIRDYKRAAIASIEAKAAQLDDVEISEITSLILQS